MRRDDSPVETRYLVHSVTLDFIQIIMKQDQVINFIILVVFLAVDNHLTDFNEIINYDSYNMITCPHLPLQLF